ncbi:MAG: BamA/TamA family outer membrane protein [Acidobacteria bacterium]|nr:BamA/TamA family outer membrane protein [Acidobacteriota bacterium]
MILAVLLLASFGAEAQEPRARVEVVELEIEGARAVDESDLRALLATRESPWLPWRDRAYFDPAVFDQDLKRMETLYAERGYPQARVNGIVSSRRDNEVALRIVVEEGEPVRAAEVSFAGFDVLPAEQVDAIRAGAAVRPGEPVARAGVQETARMAVAALWNAGYARARVDVLETTIAPGRVRVEFRAEPGLQTVFGPIDIAGNVTVADPLIRRQLAYLPGQLFQAAALEESRRRLERLGLFESVDIAVVERGRPDVETLVTVKERDHTQFTYSFGYGSEEGAYGEAGWRHLNFLGGARTVSARGRWSWLDRGGEAAFIQPYLFGAGLTLTLRGYAWQLDETVFEALSRGGRAGVSYERGRNTFTATYVHERDRVELPSGALGDAASRVLLTSLGVDEASGRQEGLLSALEFGAARDTSRESGGVTRGYFAAARVEQAGGWLPGSFNYISLLGDARYYHGVAPVTLAGRIQYGSIAAMRARSDVPFSKRYFLGGAGTLRGWGRQEVSPLSAAGVPIGGLSLLAASGELRVPVIGPLGAVLFVDAGNVWEDAWTASTNLHANGGVGARYRSRFGLLRLDFAYQFNTIEGLRIDGEPRSRRWRMHASIGHAF